MTCYQRKAYFRRWGLPIALMLVSAGLLIVTPSALAQQGGGQAPPNDSAQAADQDSGQPAQTPIPPMTQNLPVQSTQPPPLPDANVVPQENPAQPAAARLDSGLPLLETMSPLHWGRLSLLSANLMGVYDSNLDQVQTTSPNGGQATLAQALVVYSLQHAQSQLDLQYMPMVWASSGQLHSNFTSQAAALNHSRQLSRLWSLNIHDQFRYAPAQFFWTNNSFSPDFTSFTSTTTPFLTVGHNAVLNNFDLSLAHTLNAHNSLSFDVGENYTRLTPISSQPSSASNPTVSAPTPLVGATNLPLDEQFYSTGMVTFSHTISPASSMSVNYEFSNLRDVSVDSRTNFQTVNLGYSRRLRPTLSLSVQAGPAWTKNYVTAEGQISLFKSFRKGGIAASFMRTTEFSGLISNGFNNRYDLSVSQRIIRRVGFQVGYSYVQQAYINLKQTNGAIAYASTNYYLSRNWSVYAGYYYFNSTGSQGIGRQEAMGMGLRWAWTPEHGR